MVTRGPTSPAELFDELTYSSLNWPGKTTRLRRDSVKDVRQRPSASAPAIAEIYHVNSKLFPGRIDDLAAARIDPEAVRLEFLRRRAAATPPALEPSNDSFASIRPLLSAIAEAGPLSLFYALELRVANRSQVAAHEPVNDVLHPIKMEPSYQYEAMLEGVEILQRHSGFTQPPIAFLFVVGSFVRNEVLFGDRGYRTTLIEAGRLAEIIAIETQRRGLGGRQILEFYDRTVDALVEVDGVQQGTLLVIEVREER